MVEENGRMMRESLWPPFFSALISVIYGPQWRQKFAGNTCLKIAQSGHRLDHRYSVDGRSVGWAPDRTEQFTAQLCLDTLFRAQEAQLQSGVGVGWG